MKLSIGNGYGSISCALDASPTLRLANRTDRDCAADTAGYAVCRFLRRSGALRKDFVMQSYTLRLAKGGGRKAVRRRFTAPAALLELPGAWCAARLTVSATGVVVEAVGLFETLELAMAF